MTTDISRRRSGRISDRQKNRESDAGIERAASGNLIYKTGVKRFVPPGRYGGEYERKVREYND